MLDGFDRVGDELRAVEERLDLHALGQNVFVQFLNLVVDAPQHRVGVVALLQQDNALHGVWIVHDLSVFAMNGSADLAKANLGTLRDGRDVLDLHGRAVRRFDDGVFNVLHAGKQARGLHIDLLRSLLDEAAAAVGIVGRDLLLDLPNAQAVRDQLLRIELDLVLLGGPAEARHIHHALHALERLFQRPVFERLLLHHVVGGIGAFQRVPVDLAHRAPVGAHLRNQIGRQIDLAQPLQHMLTIDVAGRVVVENQRQARQASQRRRAQMCQMRNAGHLNFHRHRHLALDLLGAAPRPLGNDLDVIVGDVRIGLDRQVAEADHAPRSQQHHGAEHHPAIFESEIDKSTHHWFPAVSSSSALPTTCWPGWMPERISWLLPSIMRPARTSTRLNWFPPAGKKTQSRSCKWSTASEGTTAWTSLLLLVKVAVENMPSLRNPGLRTSMRTLAVLSVGSRMGPMSPMRPVSGRSGNALNLILASCPSCSGKYRSRRHRRQSRPWRDRRW